MNARQIASVIAATLLVGTLLAVPAAAHPDNYAESDIGSSDGGTVDECKNAENGPNGDGGPPGFVGGLVPDFISDLIGGLPVPNFVKSLFGASTC